MFLAWSSYEELRPDMWDPICDPHERYPRPVRLIRIGVEFAFSNSVGKRTCRDERKSNDVTFEYVVFYIEQSHHSVTCDVFLRDAFVGFDWLCSNWTDQLHSGFFF